MCPAANVLVLPCRRLEVPAQLPVNAMVAAPTRPMTPTNCERHYRDCTVMRSEYQLRYSMFQSSVRTTCVQIAYFLRLTHSMYFHGPYCMPFVTVHPGSALTCTHPCRIIREVVEKARGKHYQLACGLAFEGITGSPQDTGINKPSEYYAASIELAKSRAAAADGSQQQPGSGQQAGQQQQRGDAPPATPHAAKTVAAPA